MQRGRVGERRRSPAATPCGGAPRRRGRTDRVGSAGRSSKGRSASARAREGLGDAARRTAATLLLGRQRLGPAPPASRPGARSPARRSGTTPRVEDRLAALDGDHAPRRERAAVADAVDVVDDGLASRRPTGGSTRAASARAAPAAPSARPPTAPARAPGRRTRCPSRGPGSGRGRGSLRCARGRAADQLLQHAHEGRATFWSMNSVTFAITASSRKTRRCPRPVVAISVDPAQPRASCAPSLNAVSRSSVSCTMSAGASIACARASSAYLRAQSLPKRCSSRARNSLRSRA